MSNEFASKKGHKLTPKIEEKYQLPVYPEKVKPENPLDKKVSFYDFSLHL